ncbi:MAG: hypothetical protein L6R43_16400 [Planctomycetes bacterium]|nr:hypothetical protein [Planctomycetota bacterium]
MATLHLRRFADPGFLRTIRVEHLEEFLARWSMYFATRGVGFEGDALDHAALAGVFVAPDEGTPSDLLDALYRVHEMADEEGMRALLEANRALPAASRVDFGDSPDLTPADAAVLVWLRAPRLLEEKHADQHLVERSSFEYYASREAPRGEFSMPSAARLDAIERDLGEWFASRKKGREGEKARVFPYPRPDGIWFLVRHGGTFRREGALRDGEPSSVFYRPEVYDVVVYEPNFGELRVNAASKGERDLYRTKFGLHLFGREDHFPDTGKKYTLEPLKAGRDAIVCTDVRGMEWVRLVEVRYSWGNEVEIRQAEDLYANLEDRNRTMPAHARIVGARFRVKFRDSRAPRSVSLRVPNVARFTRDEDGALVEAWLQARGFTLPRAPEPDEEHEKALAIA